MESVFSRAYAWISAISPRVVLAAKLAFALLAIVIVGMMVDWAKIITDLGGLFIPILAGIGVLIPVTMVTALRWTLLIGTETPRHFSFPTAVRGWCLGWFVNLVMPGLVGGDVPTTRAFGLKSNIRGLFLSSSRSGRPPQSLSSGRYRRGTQRESRTLHSASSCAACVGLGDCRRDCCRRRGSDPAYTQVSLLLFPLLLILSLVGQSPDFLLIHFYGRILSVNIPVETLLIVVPLIFIATVVPLTPGGHGIREVTLTALLKLAGIPVSEAALVALMLFVTKNRIWSHLWRRFDRWHAPIPQDRANRRTNRTPPRLNNSAQAERSRMSLLGETLGLLGALARVAIAGESSRCPKCRE
jgi:uncharacterized membrane protein YbhN (UPF0104 family)